MSPSHSVPKLLAAPTSHTGAFSKQGEVARASAVMWKEARGVKAPGGGKGNGSVCSVGFLTASVGG